MPVSFHVENVLSHVQNEHRINVLGTITDDTVDVEQSNDVHQAILLIEKLPFEISDIDKLFKDFSLEKADNLTKTLQNDIYTTYKLKLTEKQNEQTQIGDIKITAIYPATANHIQKYSQSDIYFISESPETFVNLVEPYFKKCQLSLQWIDNLLKQKADDELPQGEEFYYNNTDEIDGFVVMKDYKWDGINKENFHIITLARNPELQSIRNLRGKHSTLIEQMLEKTFEIIKQRLNIPSNKINAYFHYPPSFYRLHIHFTGISRETIGGGLCRSRLAQDVLDNIKSDPNFYANRRICYTITKAHALFNDLVECDVSQP